MYSKCRCLLGLFTLVCFHSFAATPFEGPYLNLFGGYAYVPNNINTANFKNVTYQAGYDAGGSFGFKSGPIQYEAQFGYIYGAVKDFDFNNVNQTTTSGRSAAAAFMLDLLVQIEDVNPLLAPFFGVGVGVARVETRLISSVPNDSRFNENKNNFAYQGIAGIAYNFSESVQVDVHYRYFVTTSNNTFNRAFQAHLANLGLTYRYDS